MPFSVVGRPECLENRDCRNSEVCHTGSCLDACLVLPCGVNAICMSHLHDVTCKCPPGYTGNPDSECILSMLIFFSFIWKVLAYQNDIVNLNAMNANFDCT